MILASLIWLGALTSSSVFVLLTIFSSLQAELFKLLRGFSISMDVHWCTRVALRHLEPHQHALLRGALEALEEMLAEERARLVIQEMKSKTNKDNNISAKAVPAGLVSRATGRVCQTVVCQQC
jgi:hypothetical protein